MQKKERGGEEYAKVQAAIKGLLKELIKAGKEFTKWQTAVKGMTKEFTRLQTQMGKLAKTKIGEVVETWKEELSKVRAEHEEITKEVAKVSAWQADIAEIKGLTDSLAKLQKALTEGLTKIETHLEELSKKQTELAQAQAKLQERIVKPEVKPEEEKP